ncbi:hypothetical protein ASPCADRAFT_204620, partial [Aspergillus carbonarius ITEM 5010]
GNHAPILYVTFFTRIVNIKIRIQTTNNNPTPNNTPSNTLHRGWMDGYDAMNNPYPDRRRNPDPRAMNDTKPCNPIPGAKLPRPSSLPIFSNNRKQFQVAFT